MVGVSNIENSLSGIASSFYFKGSIKSKDDLPLNNSIGDVYISNNDNTTWVCTTTTGKWDTIGFLSDYSFVEEKHIIHPTNCKNCGAILHNHICEYCGSDNQI